MIELSQLPDLMTEVATLKISGMEGVNKDTEEDVFKILSMEEEEEKEKEGKVKYPLLSRLGYAMANISSSSAERDFSLMNAFLADKSKNRTSLLNLLALMHVKAECLSLSRNCKECTKLKQEGKEKRHCHCAQWKP